MASSIVTAYPTGATLYATVLDQDGKIWNGTAFEDPVAANWSTYDVALTEHSTTGVYEGTFPSGIAAGQYDIYVRLQAGGSPAATDLTVHVIAQYRWTGTAQAVDTISYTPVVIAAGDYGQVRLALGFTATDTVNVPDDAINVFWSLPFVESIVTQDITTYATILDSGDADYDARRARHLKAGVILWDASRIAARWLAARTGEEAVRKAVGGVSYQYRRGPEWRQLAEELAVEAAGELAQAERWGLEPLQPALHALGGPTRAAIAADDPRSTSEWLQVIVPTILDPESAI